jgi:hypothetical protein
MVIKKYNLFLNEGRGITDIIKEYTNIIVTSFQSDEYKLMFSFDYDALPLINLRIIFIKSNRYYGLFNPIYSKFINNKLHDVVLNIVIDGNDIDLIKIKGIIIHELTHAKEFYDIGKKNEQLKIKILPVHIDIKQINNDFIYKEKTFEEFFHLIYLSLDDEMNARISQIYPYFFNFKIKDEIVLFDKLKNHENWKFICEMKSFNYKKFVEYNIEQLGLNGLMKITNDITVKFKNKDLNKRSKMLYFLKDVYNLDDINEYYKNWSLYFDKKANKHIDKIKYIIKEVVEDLNGKRPWNESYRSDLKINSEDI